MTDIQDTRPFADLASRHAVVFRSMRQLRERWQARQREKANRREIRELRELDDYVLEDLRLSRADLWWAANLPMHVDAYAALGDIRQGGRAAGRGSSAAVHARAA